MPLGATQPNTQYERLARRQGFNTIAGVDEVGRGCLFGPVVAAAVVLDPARQVRGLNDSKLLDAKEREVLAARIRERALAVSVGAVDAATIDLINILQASRLAMKFAVEGLSNRPDYLLVDYLALDLPIAQIGLVKGDKKSRSIAAASIIAKVERDRWMRAWDVVYPEYGLASNKGYSAPKHLAALATYGGTPLHRMSFSPVTKVAAFAPHAPRRQLNLFE